ncbi:MAG TPA: tRNA (cytidine(34)-2'-O)-methyltransferase [Sphaerochaeta sp.]|nr:tRNA (cytidine(34)-2'-O)-methyltransferase [Sphaerochaeta sp.]
MALNIVLIEPEIPQNTGNIVRTSAALGATLHLVHPLGYSLDEKHLKRAGLDYWPKLDLVEWPDAASFFRAKEGEELYYLTTKAPRSYAQVHYPDEVYLVFGKESAGLDEAILAAHPDRCLRIPMREAIRSLNLSNSVAIAAYEWERQRTFEGLVETGALHHLTYKEIS